MKEKTLLLLLKSCALLPLWVLYLFSDIAYIVIYYLVRYRREVVSKNLREAFPEKDDREIKNIGKQYYHYLSDQIVETIKIFHISNHQLSRRVKVVDYDIVNDSLKEGKNCVVMMAHYGNWEWVQEIAHYFLPEGYMASIYRPLNSKLWDGIFKELRSRWHAHIVPMQRVTRVLLDRDNFPWVCGFIADQRPPKKGEDNWVEFLNHKTWFIYGPEEIGRKVGADFFYLEMLRKKRGYYEIKLHKLNPNENEGRYPFCRDFWSLLEDTIKSHPAYWLWSHKRWK